MATFLVVLKSNSELLLVKREESRGTHLRDVEVDDRSAVRKGPSADFFRDYEIALDIMSRYMPPGPGTAAIFAGGGVPKNFIQITATSVTCQRGDGPASPHVADIQITTDNA